VALSSALDGSKVCTSGSFFLQYSPFPIDGEEVVDVAVTIGPKAKKTMKIKIPLLISGMAYGIALSEQARLSLAEAAKKTGTAINSVQVLNLLKWC
jgi:methylamine---glutamate N-methyltransferase subunit C